MITNFKMSTDPDPIDPIVQTVSTLTLTRALILYLLAVIFTFAMVFFVAKIRWFSSLIFALLVGQILLFLIFPPNKLSLWSELNSSVGIYEIIRLFTPALIVIYTVSMVFHDHRRHTLSKREKKELRQKLRGGKSE